MSGLPKRYWQFVDWVVQWSWTPDHPDGGVPTQGRASNTHSMFTMLLSYTLSCVSHLAGHLGEPDLARSMITRANIFGTPLISTVSTGLSILIRPRTSLSIYIPSMRRFLPFCAGQQPETMLVRFFSPPFPLSTDLQRPSLPSAHTSSCTMPSVPLPNLVDPPTTRFGLSCGTRGALC